MSRTIASRSSWGARYDNGVGNRPVGGLQKYLHHTVTRHLPANATVAQERVEMRTVEAIGQQRFERGISYTIAIFPSGRIYWGSAINRISYHSGGGNDGKPRNTLGAGIVLVGNTHANDMTKAQEDSLVWLLRHGVRKGWWGDPAITEGHRDFKATSCPGNYAYRKIDEINRRARGGSYADYKRNGLPSDSDLGSGSGSSPAPKPSPSKPKRWPWTGLSDRAGRGTIDSAWIQLMSDVGYKQSGKTKKQRRTLRMQHWLRAHGYYKGALDSVAGQWFIDALQRFLGDRGFYKGAYDAFRVPPSRSWGDWLKQAEIDYLNDQRRFYS